MKTFESRKVARQEAIIDLKFAIATAEAGDVDKAAFQAARGLRKLRAIYRAQIRYTKP